MVEPQNIAREDFPRSSSFSEGMVTLNVQCDNNEMNHIRDIQYIDRGEYKLTIQLILPDVINNETPLIAYVNGSAFHWQNIPCTLPRLSLLANKDIAVASVQYRGSDAVAFPAQMLDVKAAVRFLKIHCAEYGLNPENIYLMGDSSGGHTVLMAGLTAGLDEYEEDIYNEVSSRVKGIVDFYGPTNITCMNEELSIQNHIEPDSPEGFLIGRKDVHKHLDLAEPTIVMNYVTKERSIPPILMIHGTNDELVPFGQSCMLFDKLKECGKEAYFYAIEGAHHGGREFWSEQVLKIVSDFIRAH